MTTPTFRDLNFGNSEAENDFDSLERSFFPTDAWHQVQTATGTPLLVGRKGTGKSAIITRLEIEARNDETRALVRLVPADFQHVELRALLSKLVSKDATWQYIYTMVWRGVILGQLVSHLRSAVHRSRYYSVSGALSQKLTEFCDKYPFYAQSLSASLTDVIAKLVERGRAMDDPLSLVGLRQSIDVQEYKWLLDVLRKEAETDGRFPRLTIGIDGLDEYWDNSEPSLHFLAQGLRVMLDLGSKLSGCVQFVVCIRDSIFRSLIDTRSIEYDKIEGLVLYLRWDSRSLFRLVALRAFPAEAGDKAEDRLLSMLPPTVDGYALRDYLGVFVLRRPRDYINLFSHLRHESLAASFASESLVRDAVRWYCSKRLVDLENEFGHTYPGISKIIECFSRAQVAMTKAQLLAILEEAIQRPEVRRQAPELLVQYGSSERLALILISIGAIGFQRSGGDELEFVQEFSETRVHNLFSGAEQFGLHPVYSTAIGGEANRTSSYRDIHLRMGPQDYVPLESDPRGVESMQERMEAKRNETLAALLSIKPGIDYARRYEIWVREALSICFTTDLVLAGEQVATPSKRLELVFEVEGTDPPWAEIKQKYSTFRLLVECKNTEEPTDDDCSKLVRDMQALDSHVAFLAYRSTVREPNGQLLRRLRTRFQESRRSCVIVAVTNGMICQMLKKSTEANRRRDLSKLWQDHLLRWLQV